MKRSMTGTQARILESHAEQLDQHDDPQARARAAGIRGRLTMTPRISHDAAARLARNAHEHLTELGLKERAQERRRTA